MIQDCKACALQKITSNSRLRKHCTTSLCRTTHSTCGNNSRLRSNRAVQAIEWRYN